MGDELGRHIDLLGAHSLAGRAGGADREKSEHPGSILELANAVLEEVRRCSSEQGVRAAEEPDYKALADYRGNLEVASNTVKSMNKIVLETGPSTFSNIPGEVTKATELFREEDNKAMIAGVFGPDVAKLLITETDQLAAVVDAKLTGKEPVLI